MKKAFIKTWFLITIAFIGGLLGYRTEPNISTSFSTTTPKTVTIMATTTKIIEKSITKKVETPIKENIAIGGTPVEMSVTPTVATTTYYTSTFKVQYATPTSLTYPDNTYPLPKQYSSTTEEQSTECVSNSQLNFSYSTTTNIFSGSYYDNCPINDNLPFQIDILNSKNYRIYSNNGNVWKETTSHSSYFTFQKNGNEILINGTVPISLDESSWDAKTVTITVGSTTQSIAIN